MSNRQYLYPKTAAPTANDDTLDGYMVGDVWLDTTNDKIYQAIDVTAAAAIWRMVSGSCYTLQMACAAFNPLDATTYYFAGRFSVVPSTSIANMRVYVPAAGIVRAAYVNFKGTTGSNEQSTVSLRKNDTTDTTIVSTLDLSTLPAFVNNTSLNVSVAAGDYLTIKWVTPTWATNPTSIDIDALIYIE